MSPSLYLAFPNDLFSPTHKTLYIVVIHHYPTPHDKHVKFSKPKSQDETKEKK